MKHLVEGVPSGPVIDARPKSVKSKGGRKTKSLEERFWSKVDRTDLFSCWEWQASTNQGSIGYGQITERVDGKVSFLYAHRVSWVMANGPIPDGSQVLHRCDNPKCCNPAHLYLGTAADNMADKAARGRSRSRLKPEQVLKIVELHGSGWTVKRLARKFNVSESSVTSIIRGKTWAKLTGIQKRHRNGFAPVQSGRVKSSKARDDARVPF